jgi:hypothetical protein
MLWRIGELADGNRRRELKMTLRVEWRPEDQGKAKLGGPMGRGEAGPETDRNPRQR